MSDFVERRTSPKISAILGKSRDTKYETKETGDSNCTWSRIDISSCGKRVLLIGMNPRSAEKKSTKTIEQEVKEYIAIQEQNPSTEYRNGLERHLEPTRSNVIKDSLLLCKYPNETVKELVTVDLFAKRTHEAKCLIKCVKEIEKPPLTMEATEDIRNKIIGKRNKEYIVEEIKNSDIIVLGWGNIGELTKSECIRNYLSEIYNELKSVVDKCYWYGATKGGFPYHPSATQREKLQKMDESDLAKAMGIE